MSDMVRDIAALLSVSAFLAMLGLWSGVFAGAF